MTKQLVYSKDITIDNLFVGLKYISLTISGRIYKTSRSFLGWTLKPQYSYTLSVPYIDSPYFDGEYGTNKILRSKAENLRQIMLDKISEFEEENDRKNLRQGYMSFFDMVVPQLQIEIEDTSIYLNHYPFLCYGGSYRGVWQLFGHVHSGPGADGLDISRLRVLLPTQYDVGVDNNNFTPISYREVKNKIEAQKNESLDRAKA